jgi:hypothetical protein
VGDIGESSCTLLPVASVAHEPEPHNRKTHDLFIGNVIRPLADDRVFCNGHWHFDDAPAGLCTIHPVAGGPFLFTGEGVQG